MATLGLQFVIESLELKLCDGVLFDSACTVQYILLFVSVEYRPGSPSEFDLPDRETVKLQKFGKLLAGPNTSLGELSRCVSEGRGGEWLTSVHPCVCMPSMLSALGLVFLIACREVFNKCS